MSDREREAMYSDCGTAASPSYPIASDTYHEADSRGETRADATDAVDAEAEAADLLSLSCKVDSARNVFNLLSCIADGRPEQVAQVDISDEELSFTIVTAAHTMQTHCALPAELFEQYEVAHDLEAADMRFWVPLHTVLECLQVFGKDKLGMTAVALSYLPRRAVFHVVLEEEGVVTECEVRTFDAQAANLDVQAQQLSSSSVGADDDYGGAGVDSSRASAGGGSGGFLAFTTAFGESPVAAKVLLTPALLREAFVELSELQDAKHATLRLAQPSAPPVFSMRAQGAASSCCVTFEAGSGGGSGSSSQLGQHDGGTGQPAYRDLVVYCPAEAADDGDGSGVADSGGVAWEHDYALRTLQQAMKALAFAKESYVRVNQRGMLCVQHLVEVTKGGLLGSAQGGGGGAAAAAAAAAAQMAGGSSVVRCFVDFILLSLHQDEDAEYQ